MEHKERRQHPRIKGSFRVIAEPSSAFIIDWSCDCRDIGEGGIGILESREPIIGNKVEVSFTLTGTKHKISIQSKVVWTRLSDTKKGKFESGIKFIEVSEFNRQLLRAYVEKYQDSSSSAA